MNRLKRSGFIQPNAPSTKVLANKADTCPFKAVLNNKSHPLRCLFPKLHTTPTFLETDHITLTSQIKTHETLPLVCYFSTHTKLSNHFITSLFHYLIFNDFICFASLRLPTAF